MSLSRSTDSIGPLEFEQEDQLHEALLTGDLPLAVYGLGKVGLPMATVYAERTGNVVGVDIDHGVVAGVNTGRAPFNHEPGLESLLDEAVTDGSIRATTDGHAAAESARIHLVIVPVGIQDRSSEETAPSWTPEGATSSPVGTDAADLRALVSAVRDISRGLKPDDLVVVESTVPPRTTRSIVAPLLARGSGLDPSEFGVAFSPERIQSGRAMVDLMGVYPKVVGGIDTASTETARWVYEALYDGEVITVADATTAECVKLFEGIYRDVNIALANELAQTADGLEIDVLEAIEAANTQPYCDIHAPGAGVGGHCIPVYPHLFRAAVNGDTPLISTARRVNDAMPRYVVQRTIAELEATGIAIGEAAIAVLGTTYRPGIPETSNSPAEPMLEQFRAAGATVVAVDPQVEGSTVFGTHLINLEQLVNFDPDAVVVVTPHEEFRRFDWAGFDGLLIDCRNGIPDGNGRKYTVGRGRA